LLAASPFQALRTEDWRALPYENVRAHGLGSSVILFIALRLRDASSSDYPPDKKVTPGRAGTIDLERVLTVIQAISCALDLFGHSAPGVTMFGLRRSPSMRSLCWKS
jgi:hypothetical protein